MANLLSTGTASAGKYGPDAILSSAGVPVTGTPVTIYQSDGTTLATLYTDQTKASTVSNPVSTDSFGNLAFYTNPGLYVLSFTVSGVGTTKTVMVSPWYADAAWNEYTVTGNTTILSGDCVYVNAAGGAVTITLPAPALGTHTKVVKTDSSTNVVTVTTPSGVIQGLGLGAGAASQLLGAQGSFMEVHGDGTNGHIMAGSNESGWVAVPNGSMTNSWTNGANAFGYRRSANRVFTRGELLGGGTFGTALTLPVGFRPVSTNPFVQTIWDTTANSSFYVVIGTSGAVTIPTSATDTFSLDGISFTVD